MAPLLVQEGPEVDPRVDGALPPAGEKLAVEFRRLGQAPGPVQLQGAAGKIGKVVVMGHRYAPCILFSSAWLASLVAR